MAELLGVIAGGAGLASLAIQLGESAIKARRLYHAAGDAPETLQHLAFEMETFSLVVHEVARHGQVYHSGSDVVVRCVQMCEQSVTRIQAIVNKLESLINRHSRLGKRRTVVEDKELSKICNELERAKTSLGIALQLYSEYQRAKDREIIRASYSLALEQTRLLQTQVSSLANLRSIMSMIPPPDSDNIVAGMGLYHVDQVKRRRSQPSSHIRQFRFQFKPWFVSAIWQVCVCKSMTGWDLRLRTVNIVPDSAEIFSRCQDGDLYGVQKMFRDGLASPYDHSHLGHHSVLKVSKSIEVLCV